MPISECICSLSGCLHSICIPRGGEIALHIMHFFHSNEEEFYKTKGKREYWEIQTRNYLRPKFSHPNARSCEAVKSLSKPEMQKVADMADLSVLFSCHLTAH